MAVVDAIKPVRGSSSLSGGVAEILPQVSYPAELGYAGDGPSSREEGVVRSKPGKKRMQARVARKAQPRSKKVSPPRRSPRVRVGPGLQHEFVTVISELEETVWAV